MSDRIPDDPAVLHKMVVDLRIENKNLLSMSTMKAFERSQYEERIRVQAARADAAECDYIIAATELKRTQENLRRCRQQLRTLKGLPKRDPRRATTKQQRAHDQYMLACAHSIATQ